LINRGIGSLLANTVVQESAGATLENAGTLALSDNSSVSGLLGFVNPASFINDAGGTVS
jgi:hypothetical protein